MKQQYIDQKRKDCVTKEYLQLLYRLACFGTVSRQYLLFAGGKAERTLYRYVDNMVERNDAALWKLKYKPGFGTRKEVEIQYLTLTKKGFDFLCQTLDTMEDENAKWLLDVEWQEITRSLSGEKGLRWLIRSNTSAFFLACNATLTTRANLSILPEGEETEISGLPISNDEGLLFLDSDMVKRKVIYDNSGETMKYRLGRYTGILLSPLKSVLIFTPGKYTVEMLWNTNIQATERKTFEQITCSTEMNPYKETRKPTLDNPSGIILIENVKSLEDLYFRKRVKETERKQSEPFGQGLKSLVVMPVNANGVLQVKEYMTISEEEKERELIASALEAGCQKNDGDFKRLFPLRTKRGTLVKPMYYLDLVMINTLRDITEKARDKIPTFGIYCPAWQEEYYKCLLPQAHLELYEEGR